MAKKSNVAVKKAASPVPPRNPYMDGSGKWGPPSLNSELRFSMLGSSGLRQFSGWVREEFLPQLQGRQACRTYREMLDNSPTIGAVNFAITQSMRQVEWRVVPASDKPEALAAAEFVESCMDDMSNPWTDFAMEQLSMLGYGFAFHELIYKRRMGKRNQKTQPDGSRPASSKYDDGLIGWRKIPLRGQDTIIKWFFASDGATIGVTQQPWVGGLIDIPMEKGLLFRPSSHKQNPEGRALDPETPIPTPDGWRKLDDLDVGSKVFDEQGCIRYVTARADWNDRPCYAVQFGDGTEIIADANHEWLTTTLRERVARANGKIRTTAKISESLKAGQQASNHGIAWASALDYPEQMLPIDPYFLGLWLGDGTSLTSSISCHAQDAEETVALIDACGYVAKVSVNGRSENGRLITVQGDKPWDSKGPQSLLCALGLKGNKHIPAAYLRGSIEQRMALLSGLMDSDGHIDGCGRCEFTNTNYGLSAGVAELVRSLGIGARLTHKKNSHGNDCWMTKFTPTWVPFRLSRKAARCRTERQRKHHYIADARQVAPRRTVCIEVDSPSHLFLAGESMVPTHNSILRNSYRPYYMSKRLEEQEAIMFERFSGLPKITVPSQLLEAANAGDAQSMAMLESYKNIGRNVRIDDQMCVVFPSDTYKNTDGTLSAVKMYDIEFATPQSGRSTVSADTAVERYKLDMMTSTLADFLSLGHTSRGAQNLAETKVDLFFQATEGYVQSNADVMNRYGLQRLWALNAMDEELMPRFEPDMPQRIDLDGLSNFVLRLSQAGMPIFPSPEVQSYLLDAAGMPDVADDGAGEMLANYASPDEPQADPKATPPAGSPSEQVQKMMAASIARRLVRHGYLPELLNKKRGMGKRKKRATIRV